MRKLLVMLLMAVMTCSLFACNKEEVENVPSEEIVSEESSNSEEVSEEDSTENSDVATSEDASAESGATVTILADIWNAYGEADKFPAMGGDYTNMVDGAPGAMDVANTADMAALIYVPEANAADIDEAASLLHGMMLNNFTGAALHLTDASNMDAFTTALKENILGTQWMCGFPDTLVIYTVNEEYVVYAFGNVDIIGTFKNKVAEVYGENATLVAEENLAR